MIPIFYDSSLSDVKHQTGDFGRAFNLHKTAGVNSNTIRKWKEALREAGELHGYSGNLYKGYEGQLVEEVVLRVAQILRDDGLSVTDKLVGIDSHVAEIMTKLGVAYMKGQATKVLGKEVRMVGIYGMRGIGKTTLAKIVFNKAHALFEACSFLQDVNSKGVQFSQQMLIADLQKREPSPLESSDEGTKIIGSRFRHKKVLIFLDDVSEHQQIKALSGKSNWFGTGSRVIITTRNREVLSAFDIGADGYGTVEEHEVGPLRYDHALQLFRKHAFQGDAPKEVSGSTNDLLSEKIVATIGGVPRDIVRLASYLHLNMGIDSWTSTLNLLEKNGEDREAAL